MRRLRCAPVAIQKRLQTRVDGVPPPNPTDTKQKLDKKATPPEFGWWEFNVDDVTAGKGAAMSAITDAKDPDLSRFLVRKSEASSLPRMGGSGRSGAADNRLLPESPRKDVPQ